MPIQGIRGSVYIRGQPSEMIRRYNAYPANKKRYHLRPQKEGKGCVLVRLWD